MVNHFYKLYGKLMVEKYGFWFVDIPRTSSSSIRYELGNNFSRVYGKKDIVEKKYSGAQIFRNHRTAQEMKAFLGNTTWDNIFTFTMVRNPWDRILSMYNFRRKRGNIPMELSFREYVLEFSKYQSSALFKYRAHYYGVSDYIMEDGKVIVDFIARFEKRNEDLAFIAQRLGLKELGKISVQKATLPGSHYSQFYDEETKEIIKQVYEREIEIFGYEF
jgi:hypothetical protein